MKWINVNDKLPESDGRFLCCTPMGIQIVHYYFEMNRFALSTVTYWMPLPKPPRHD